MIHKVRGKKYDKFRKKNKEKTKDKNRNKVNIKLTIIVYTVQSPDWSHNNCTVTVSIQ